MGICAIYSRMSSNGNTQLCKRAEPNVPAPTAMKALVALLVPSVLAAQAQPVPQTTAKPGWQWTMDSVMKAVNTVRAGRSRPLSPPQRCAPAPA